MVRMRAYACGGGRVEIANKICKINYKEHILEKLANYTNQ